MARSISAAVGDRCSNIPKDVKTVQELLNNVPPEEGGPKRKLAVDGQAGKGTIDAIRNFQYHHGGFDLADGKVEPDGPTLLLLQQYSTPRPPPEPEEPVEPEPSYRPAVYGGDDEIKILVLSDLHVAAWNNWNSGTKGGLLREKLASLGKTYANSHYFIIPGDIIDNEGDVDKGTKVPIELSGVAANVAPYTGPLAPVHFPNLAMGKWRAMREQALNNANTMLRELVGLGRVFVCPGNHDFSLWGNICLPGCVEDFRKLIWIPVNGAHWPKVIDQQGRPSESQAEVPEDVEHPLLYELPNGSLKVQLIGLNSCTRIWPPTAIGAVGKAQLDGLTNYFKAQRQLLGPQPVVRIVFCHHHPWLDQLKEPFFGNAYNVEPGRRLHTLEDGKELLNALRKNVSLLVFGHVHCDRRFEAGEIPGGGIAYGAISAGTLRTDTYVREITVKQDGGITVKQVPIFPGGGRA